MDDLIERMRSLEQDHEPEGWPAVQMRDISALCDALEAARIQDVSQGWKAVPVEPNSEMVDAAADAYTPFGDMELAIRCAILAAPQPPVEQEPRAMTDLNPCWKCGSPGVIDENGGYQYAVCTNTRGCSNSGNWGIEVADWNRGGLTEFQELRQQLKQAKQESERVRQANIHTMEVFEDMKTAKERAERRVAELEQVATSVRRDLILRAEPDWDGSGPKVVNLSAGIWDELNRVLDIKGNRRKAQAQTCSYPECNCPFDMGPDHQCLRGLPVIRK